MYRDNRRYYKSDKNRNQKLLLKALFCVAGIIVLAFIASTYRNYKIREGKEPYVKLVEVKPVIEAFVEVKDRQQSEELQADGNSKDGEKENEVQTVLNKKFTFLNESEQEYLTYDNLLTILAVFPIEDTQILEDYKKTEWYVGLADWNQLLYQMVEAYGNGEIQVREQKLLGTAEHITREDGTGLSEREVLTPNGVYENKYWNLEAFLFSNVTAVCYRNHILTLIEKTDEQSVLRNVYLADASDNKTHFFWNGYHMTYSKALIEQLPVIEQGEEVSRKIVDIGIENGKISITQEKNEYVHGKLMQVSQDSMEIEGHGTYPMDEEMKIYRLYGELASGTQSDLRIGYSFTDYVIEDGKIVACLIIKEEDMQYIRVLLKDSNLSGRHHESFRAYCSQDCELITYIDGVETGREKVSKGEEIVIKAEDIAVNNERIRLQPMVLSAKTTIESIERSQGIPSYFGTLEITREEEGLLIINEVLLEDYLCRVVPSEMPSSYPKEALMTQAICARTYAYGKMLKSGLPQFGAHVDDSAGFQVYNNISEQASTTEAVKATHNMIAVYEEEPIGAYYYSTSCGIGSDTGVWHGGSDTPPYLSAREIGTEAVEATAKGDVDAQDLQAVAQSLIEEENFREWIMNTDSSHYESEEGWYRWTYEVEEIDTAHMEEVLKNRYAANPNLILTENKDGEFESKEIDSLGEIEDIRITKRISGGVADELVIVGKKATIKVLSELNIRYVLSDGITKVLRQTQDEVNASATLPSAFIVVDLEKEDGKVTGYRITGGGFGHGVGMSQNGAKNMAESGMSCEEIITFYYPGITLKTLQFEE